MSRKFVKDLKPTDTIDQTFQVLNYQQRTKKDGFPYLHLELRDRSGKIQAKMWDNLPQDNSITQYGFVRIQGKVEEYKGETQIIISSLKAIPEGEVYQQDFILSTPKNIDELYKRFKEIISQVKDKFLVKLMDKFLSDNDFVEKFKKTPAAVEIHHAYSGGLLEHTVNLLNLGLKISDYYQTINTDLLITGIFLHDIGKIKEYEIRITPQHTDEGRLVGHTILGIMMLEEKIKNITGFPADYKYLLEHLIASHHGLPEYGAVVLPMTQEALVLHYLDNLDAKMGEYKTISENTTDKSIWTEWSKSLERRFYIKKTL
jgi:3'-5' exoribonuclease